MQGAQGWPGSPVQAGIRLEGARCPSPTASRGPVGEPGAPSAPWCVPGRMALEEAGGAWICHRAL